MNQYGRQKLLVIKPGQTRYQDAWELQKKLVALRYQEKIPDSLILTEHKPVITMGRGTSKKNLLVSSEELRKRHIDLYEIERGGDITFHGPGQAVIYPIINLESRGRDLHKYLRSMEHLIIAIFHELGLEADTKPGMTGVWVDNKKVAAIGVAVSKWVAYHGAALNISPQLEYFDLIIPCGITQYAVGSLKSILGKDIDMERIYKIIAEKYCQMFEYEIEPVVDLQVFLTKLEVAKYSKD
ncbi:MAG: lipoyl(octanoyl) transferase LipB [candidate division Zixibacteria bacterium]|nr:lipoyl(octanoyl) transferase LipB [candidate division Zixibacteria bacterium]